MNYRYFLLLALLTVSALGLFGSCGIEPEEYEVETARREPANCILEDDTEVQHGDQFIGFENSAVSYGQTCQSKIQTCEDGEISGGYRYSSCNVAASNACVLDGKIIESGNSTIAYSSTTIQYSGQCSTISEIRNCTNGTLSGSYPYATCTPLTASDCYFDGIDSDLTVSNGDSIVTYSTNLAPYLSQCSTYSESRTCNDGSLTGSYQYASCAVDGPASCTLNGLTASDNTSATFYFQSTAQLPTTCQSEQRYCRNGIFETGSYTNPNCVETCDWAGGDFDNGSFGDTNIDNWTIVNAQMFLGTTSIAGQTTPSDSTLQSADQNVPSSKSFSTSRHTNTTLGTGFSIKMSSSLTSQANCDIVRGPYMYSNINADLDVGDNISFDWQAIGGADAYDVFGFILDVNDGYSEIILDQYSNYNNRYTSWTTVTHQVSRKGDYKFVFVSGSYDATCGKALGSDLYIDNVKVYFSDNTTSTFCK